MRNLLALAVLVLVVYALVDCFRTKDDEVRNLPKVLWVVLIILLPAVGSVAWLLGGRRRSSAAPPARRGGLVGPDDDPEFLWRLEQERRRRRDGGGTDSGPGSPGGTTGPTPA